MHEDGIAMDTITRRKFIQMTGAGAIAAAAHTLSIEEIAQAAINRPLPLGTPILHRVDFP